MKNWQLNTPVVFLVFNRPDTTRRVFEAIRQARPPRLLVVADGPRSNRSGEGEKCANVRAIIDEVDWPCEVLKNYSDINLGCKQRVSSGLDWAFSTVEEAIILEDDCVPHPTFFRFCEELLEKYRDDERIMHISGVNFQSGRKHGEASYYFSRYPHVWGWATWKRAWQYFDVNISQWVDQKKQYESLNIFKDENERRFFQKIWDAVYMDKLDSWDYSWTFACLTQKKFSITSNFNLVSNIGFGSDSTHTRNPENPVANLLASEMSFPLKHPETVAQDIFADENTSRMFFSLPSLPKRVFNKIRNMVFNFL